MARNNRWWAKVAIYLMLETGALFGVPMRPEDIEAMTRVLNGSVGVEVVQSERSGPGEPPSDDE